MGASARKHKRTDDESDLRRQNLELPFHSKVKHRLLNRRDEQNKAASSTKFYDVPLEVLDIIIIKSYLHSKLYSSTKQRHKEVVRSLVSVDVSFYQRMTTQRFKKAVEFYLEDLYEKTQKIYTIIRMNRSYLLENIQPIDELIEALFTLDCITEKQSHFFQRQLSNRDKNAQLLYFLRSLDDTKFPNLVKCLRGTNQTAVAKIIENGEEEQQRLLNEKDEQNKEQSRTTLYGIPLEVIDIILQKSYLHWILNSSTRLTDGSVIRSLISVDVCFNRRITGQRFKKAIWRRLKEKKNKRSSIIRNNRNYLLETIQPTEEFIALLLSLNCITNEQRHLIEQQRSNRNKNADILHVVGSFDEDKFSDFLLCLRQANQSSVAKIVANGGVVIEVTVTNCGATCTASLDLQLLHQGISDLRKRTNPISHQTDKLISELKEEGIEFLSSQLDRKTTIVWIWCRSQAALETIQKLYKSNQLRDIFLGLTNIQPRVSEIVQSIWISIDSNEFKKTMVVFPIAVNFTEKLGDGRIEGVCGVTQLRNEIYVLCRSYSSASHIIRVFEDRNPVRLQTIIDLKTIKSPEDIGSSENENCLYVSCNAEKFVWKITREADNQHKIIRWLDIGHLRGDNAFYPSTLSVSSDGRLLVFNNSLPTLMIYGSDGKLTRSIQLPRDIEYPLHAVETSIGNFFIVHRWIQEAGESGSDWREWVVSELARDGEMVIRCFIPSNEAQGLKNSCYVSLDSDDRVFVADKGNGRVILLDSDLTWNRIICPTKEEPEKEDAIREPWRLYYVKEKKQLIVGGDFYLGEAINVYTLS